MKETVGNLEEEKKRRKKGPKIFEANALVQLMKFFVWFLVVT